MANLCTLLNGTSQSQTITSLLAELPKEVWLDDYDLYKWEGSWYFPAHIDSTLAFQSHFKPLDDDVIIASPPKAGTTWLKALLNIKPMKNGCLRLYYMNAGFLKTAFDIWNANNEIS
ncbi:Sulfotransferase, partial [Thalictrum thalictroides]